MSASPTSERRTWIIVLWLTGLALALWIVAHAQYITDLSAFLPAKPTPMQRLLVDQLRDGPTSRLILIALEGGDSIARANIAKAVAQGLRGDSRFLSVDNGDAHSAERDRNYLFQHRYVLSSSVTEQRFSAPGLKAAIEETILNLASSSGVLLKSMVPRDPTGEMLNILDQLSGAQGPRTQNGVWVSAGGARTLMVAQTAASGSDTDAQERGLDAIRSVFGAAASAATSSPAVRLRMSGPGVFAVTARAKIKHAAMRLAILSGILVTAVLLLVYRSMRVLTLGLLPVATGALVGVAAVALGFGSVHGITLGFGITLIGESVDYSIYFFIQSRRRGADCESKSWQRRLWPTIRLGMLTSVCGFASMLPSGFPGLAQLGLYSIGGLLAAASVTRFVLPVLLPREFAIRDLAPLGMRMGRLRDYIRGCGSIAMTGSACAIAAIALSGLYRHHNTLWNRELSALSPVPLADQHYDATLRSDLGAANVLDIVVVGGPDLETVLRDAERAQTALQPLIDATIIGAFDSPARYLPSLAAQQARRDALPHTAVLRDNLKIALADLDLKADQLSPFIEDVEAAHRAPLVTAKDLQGTSLAQGFGALILQQPGHFSALLPLHAVSGPNPDIDIARVSAALAAANLADTQVLDMKRQTDALYADYLHQAIGLSLGGFGLIVLLLGFALRSTRRVARVLAPLMLAVLTVAAGLTMFGQQLTLLHLVGMLLIVAVGSNYALFFDEEETRPPDATSPLTLASLGIANISTVMGFGFLSFSQVPVLEALGTTVAPGAFLALVFCAMTGSRAHSRPT